MIGTFLEATKFFIAIGGEITTTVYNPIAAVSVWFASFYIFNLEYSPRATATTEFVQRQAFFVIIVYD